MSPPTLFFSKKNAADPKSEVESRDRNKRTVYDSPAPPSDEKHKKNRSLELLLELCRKGVAKSLSREHGLPEEVEGEEPEKGTGESVPLIAPCPWIPLPSELSMTSETIPTSEPVSEVVSALFDKLCTEMIVMDGDRCTNTTIVLSGERFSGSPLQGASITVSEYSTAPKMFNVTIAATEEALRLVREHTAHFFELLETRNFSFAIHRIDTDLQTDLRDPEEDLFGDERNQEDL